MNGKDLLKLLRKNGWTVVRVRGSHFRVRKGSKQTTVPVHAAQDIDKGLLGEILKYTGLKDGGKS